MRSTLRVSMLASVIGAALIGSAWQPQVAFAAEGQSVEQRESYIVKFAEPGLLYYKGGIEGLRATAPKAEGTALEADSPAAIEYKEYLGEKKAVHTTAISNRIGRAVVPTHEYVAAYNGVAMMLTASEAAKVAATPGVIEVRLAGEERLHTYRGPSFIGADTVWSGVNVPPGLGGGTRGQGVVIGVLDSGVNSDHPSFANDTSCGFSAANPKLLSARDCAASAGGVCTGPTPEDDEPAGSGHGSHTASTAGGNTLTSATIPLPPIPAGFSNISGVAPCAQVRTYKVCPASTCPGAAIQAGIENAILDGVDVINFSISGGTNPWTDFDRNFLDATNAGIFIAASAGNTRAETPNPVGAVNHLGPWVTTVANSTHDCNTAGSGGLSATGSTQPPPAGTQNLVLTPGGSCDPGVAAPNLPIRRDPTNNFGCEPFPAGFFNGSAALIQRGPVTTPPTACSFEVKINNAAAAGAAVALIYNHSAGVINMATGGASLPAYSLLQVDGDALVAYMATNGAGGTTVNFTPAAAQGDVINGSSLRGPSSLVSVTKPDITGPGTNILAATGDASSQINYGRLTGTSMSSPHIAGAAALIRSVQTAWSPAEVRSAMMLTASRPGFQEDGTTPWNADIVGSGRIDLTKAVKAGLLMNETFSGYLAANPATGGNPATLNLPSMRNVACVGSCAWTRTMKNALTVPTTWNVTVETPAGVTLAVVPNTFSFTGQGPSMIGDLFRSGFEDAPPIETQQIVITATPTQTLTNMTFARVIFTEANGRAPQSSMFVSIRNP